MKIRYNLEVMPTRPLCLQDDGYPKIIYDGSTQMYNVCPIFLIEGTHVSWNTWYHGREPFVIALAYEYSVLFEKAVVHALY